MARYDVLGIGNALMDILAPVTDARLGDLGIAKGGMMLIDEGRAEHLTGQFTDAVERAGGSAGNTMVGIAKLGLRAAYLANTAADPVGDRLSAAYRRAGLDFPVPAKPSGLTGRCLIAVSPDGERSMSTLLGVASDFAPRDVTKAAVQSADTVYLEGYLFDRDPAKRAFVRAAEMAHAAGNKVALTLSDDFCVHGHRAAFRQLVDHNIDILFANESELLALYETDDLRDALSAFESAETTRHRTACITRSAQGSVISDAGARIDIPAMPVAHVVDTTGAGDQYAAGVLTGRALGLSWRDAGHLGSVAAGEVITHYGPQPEIPIHDLALRAEFVS